MNLERSEQTELNTILLDQFKEGLRKVGIFYLIAAFPEEKAGLFIWADESKNQP